ncbi:MAG: septal ring lytic transglycosylase RlpA family protein [Gemmatimonadales bacterium]
MASVDRGWSQRGIASWYGPGFHGKSTASGERYDQNAMTAAHKQLPFQTWVRVDNLDNGRSVAVRINDRGPFVAGRIIDLSRAAAQAIGMVAAGTARVSITVTTPARESSCLRVQVGSYEKRSNAEARADRLRADGERPRLERGPGGVIRVFIGPFTSRTAAERHRRRYDGVIAPCAGR